MDKNLVKKLRARADREDNYYKHGGDVIREAADAIEELSKSRWIPVTERLPEKKRASYLCLTDGGYCKQVRWTNSIYGLVESDNWGWSIFDVPQFSHVTHWMPLPPDPEPPKEE